MVGKLKLSDLEKHLLRKRVVAFSGRMSKKSAARIVEKLKILHGRLDTEVVLTLDCPKGGNPEGSRAIMQQMDAMKSSNICITTVGRGSGVSSAGAYVLMAGSKRLCWENVDLFLHAPLIIESYDQNIWQLYTCLRQVAQRSFALGRESQAGELPFAEQELVRLVQEAVTNSDCHLHQNFTVEMMHMLRFRERTLGHLSDEQVDKLMLSERYFTPMEARDKWGLLDGVIGLATPEDMERIGQQVDEPLPDGSGRECEASSGALVVIRWKDGSITACPEQYKL